jgi:hypothetical protein
MSGAADQTEIARPDMQRKKAILHIGAHKTGTTNFQDTLFANRELLENSKIKYLSRKEMRNRRVLKHIRAYYKSGNPVLNYWLNYFRPINRFKRDLERFDTVFFSEENMIGLTRELLRPSFYPNYEDNLLPVKHFFSDREIEIAFSLRCYSEIIPSAFAQSLRGARTLEPIGYYCDRFDDEASRPSWATLLQDVHAIFPASRFKVWTLETFARNKATIFRKLLARDLADTDVEIATRTRSPSAETIAKAVEITRLAIDNAEKRRLITDLFRNDQYLTKYDPLSESTKTKLNSCYRADIEKIKNFQFVDFIE